MTALPNDREAITEDGKRASMTFRRWLESLGSNASVTAEAISAIATALGSPDGTVANIPDQDAGMSFVINGGGSVAVTGTLESGVFSVTLANDSANPGNTYYYGTDAAGAKAWQPVADAVEATSGDLTKTVGSDGVTTFGLEDTGVTPGSYINANLTLDAKGRVLVAANGSGISDGDKGDITVSSSGAVWAVDNNAITYAKMQDISAASRLLGRGDSGSGDPQEIILGSGLSMTGTTLSSTAGGGSVAPGYIDGLVMEWLSTTSIRVASGSAYIPSLGGLYTASSVVNSGTLSLSANAWYHVYFYNNAGTPAIEVVTTAPATAYSGTARAKTGDTSRRYLGSIRTGAGGAIYNFQASVTRVNYLEQTDLTPFRVLSGGNATTATTVSASSVAPLTARLATLRLISDSSQAARYKNLASTAAYVFGVGAAAQTTIDMPLDGSQSYQYFNAAAIGGSGVFNDVIGYVYER